jgi:hypothetical protein
LERIDSGKALLASIEEIKEAVLLTSGYERSPDSKHIKRRDSLSSEYVRWNDFNKELLHRLFNSPEIAAEYSASREPESTYGVFLSEVDEFHNDIEDDLQRLQSIKERLPLFEELQAASGMRKQSDSISPSFVAPSRIEELLTSKSKAFDFTKLVRLCEELNLCFSAECYLATSMVTRSVLDHVPPVFGCKTFQEVANNYPGSKSFRESIQHLEKSSRKIADQHLHCQIRKSEVLPTTKQVDCSQDLDVLLAEVVRLTKRDFSQGQDTVLKS